MFHQTQQILKLLEVRFPLLLVVIGAFFILLHTFNFIETAGEDALQKEANDKGNVERVSTRTWAQSNDYDPEKLFTKLFHEDIKYLLSMDNLWKKRRPPVPLDWNNLSDEGRIHQLKIRVKINVECIHINFFSFSCQQQ